VGAESQIGEPEHQPQRPQQRVVPHEAEPLGDIGAHALRRLAGRPNARGSERPGDRRETERSRQIGPRGGGERRGESCGSQESAKWRTNELVHRELGGLQPSVRRAEVPAVDE